jgi:hypothetical protein
MSSPDRPAAAVIEAGGVYLPATVCLPLWRVMQRHFAQHRAEGGRVRPEIADALAKLRAAGLADLSANGPDLRTLADIDAESDRDAPVTTADLAGRLRVTERHARRIAAAEGITPLARGLWRRDDADHLTRTRSPQCPRPPPE